jgi:hypothetical protein
MSDSTMTAVTRHGAPVHILRTASRQGLSGQLVDCSRAVVQFRVTDSLADGERVVVRLRHEASGLQLDMAGTVDWQRPEPSGERLVGCRFAEELDWETLGELFLCGILDTAPRQTEGASAKQAEK